MSATGQSFTTDPGWPSIVELATEKWGEPNKRLSRPNDIRFGNNGSLSVRPSENTWYDHEADKGGGYLDMHFTVRGELPKSASGSKPRRKLPAFKDIASIYPYHDQNGALVLEVIRTITGKPRFRQRASANGPWSVQHIPGHNRLLYRLPGLRASGSEWVFICEGEKDADRLHGEGAIATTNIGGAGKWRPEYAEEFGGKPCAVLQDNDQAGRDHVAAVARSLAGIASTVKVLLLPNLPPKGDVSDWLDAGGTIGDLERLAHEAPEYQPPQPDTESTALCRLGVWNAGHDDYVIPPREWLLGNIFCKKFLSSLIADGAVGKTALRIAQVLSLVTSRNLTGEHVFRRCRAIILSFEDDKDELRRRVYAAMLKYGIAPCDIDGWLFLAAPKGLKLARMVDGSPQADELENLLRETIATLHLDLVCLDPFIKTHSVGENDNNAIDFVCDLLATIAIDLNCAIDFPHHTNKGLATPGDANRGRGASSAKDAGRLVYTLTPMTMGESNLFGLSEADRRSLIRLDNGKVNIAPPSADAKWFRLIGQSLGNSSPDYPRGDDVQTVEPWPPPDTWAGLDRLLLNRILDAIDAGMKDGQRYSAAASATSKRAAWLVVHRHTEKPENVCRSVISAWVKSGTLFTEGYHDPIQRKALSGLRVNPNKRPT